jgi:hypothetical protein
MAELQAKECRRAERFPLLVRVECKTTRKFLVGRCDNISETGLLLKTSEPFSVSTPVTVRFPLLPINSGTIVQTEGVVARAEQGKYMGIRFTGMQTNYRSAIKTYIERSFGTSRRNLE